MKESVECPHCGKEVVLVLQVLDVEQRRAAGQARQAKVTPEERSAKARAAAQKRWAGVPNVADFAKKTLVGSPEELQKKLEQRYGSPSQYDPLHHHPRCTCVQCGEGGKG